MRGFFKAYIRHCDIFLDFTFIYDTQVQFKTYYACSIFFNSASFSEQIHFRGK